MKFSFNWVLDFLKEKPTFKEVKEGLEAHSIEIETIEKQGSDYILDLKVLPNRMGDMSSHFGLAREIAAILGLPKPTLTRKTCNIKKKRSVSVGVTIKSKSICSRYMGIVVKDIQVKPSPAWMQERIKACGLDPINNVVDTTNYVMLETGQPMHAFDLNKIEGNRIIVRKAIDGEKLTLLGEKECVLSSSDIVVADKNKALVLAGIKGGVSSQITSETKNLFIELATFDATSVYKSSKKFSVVTDASRRFAADIDSNLEDEGLAFLLPLLEEIFGVKEYEITDIYPEKEKSRKMRFSMAKMEALLGIHIPRREVINILSRLGCKAIVINSDVLSIEIPTFRRDLQIPEDIVEEIGRIYGYDAIPLEMPMSMVLPVRLNMHVVYVERIKEFFAHKGLNEVLTYSFVPKRFAQYCNNDLLELEKPSSEELFYLRPTLLLNLLTVEHENLKRFNSPWIFEVGHVFIRKGNSVNEREMLAGIIHDKEGFYLLKGLIDDLFETLGIGDHYYDEYKPTPDYSAPILWGKQSAEVKVDETEIGSIGKISDKVAEGFGLARDVYMFEIDMAKLINLAQQEHEYKEPSHFAEIKHDITVAAAQDVLVGDVLDVIQDNGGELLRDADLFDVYTEDNKSSFSFHLFYQASDRNITQKDVDAIEKEMFKKLLGQGWEVKGYVTAK